MNSIPFDFVEARDNSIKTIRTLVTDFEHRHTGLEDERRCAEYIVKRLSDFEVEAKAFSVNVIGWKIIGKPSLQLNSPEERYLEFGPIVYSNSTGQDGILGELVYEGNESLLGAFACNKFSIRNISGKTLGYIYGRNEGLAYRSASSRQESNRTICDNRSFRFDSTNEHDFFQTKV